MDLRSGHPYWLVRNGLLHTFAPLEADEQCDVVVVGAGVTGALVAWHLVEAGFDTVVVDKRDVGWGSTAASTALLQYEIDTPLVDLSRRYGPDHATRAYFACRDAIYKLRDLVERLPDPCDFTLRPSIQIAPDARAASGLHAEFELRRKHGFAVEWLDPGKLAEQHGFKCSGGLRSTDAAQMDPYRLTYELLTQAPANRLRVYDRTAVVERDLGRQPVLLRTDRGSTIKTSHVVFATGYEAAEMLGRDIVDLRSTFAFVSEPLSAPVWVEECLFWEWANPYLYFRGTADHRVLVGGEDEPYKSAARRDAHLPRKVQTLLKKLAGYFPRLTPEVAFAWGGTFGETKDGLGYIGQVPEYRNASFALGFGGNGIVYSILAAELIRDFLRKEKNPYEGLFGFGR